MEITGMLIGLSRFDFEKDGDRIKGAKIHIASPPEDTDRNTLGYTVQTIPAPYELFAQCSEVARSHAGAEVVVTCDVSLRGRFTKLRATGIEAA